jgi:hypothetical protein
MGMTIEPEFFDAVDHGEPAPGAPLIRPWREVKLDPDYSGAWTVSGDVDGDGRAEIVTARNVDRDDVHFTSAAVAQALDGRVLWRWGDPRTGRRGLHHDVACQIHDWDGDGSNEVVLCARDHIIELDGPTGEERRRLPIPPGASDCIVFADLSGSGRASEVLIKTRYDQIWALDHAGRLLWHVRDPGGFPTAHQPVPIDVDGDGRDEVMAGYAMLNPDGRVRWVLDGAAGFRGSGHLDCCRVLREGRTPGEWRLALTCCGHDCLMVADGEGRVQWEIAGRHFESIDIGRIHAGRTGPQILVDLVPKAGQADGNTVWALDEHGVLLGRLAAEYTRFHSLVDWNGDGLDEIVLPHARGLFDCEGRRIGTFAMEAATDVYGGMSPAEGEIGNIVLRGDMTGDGVPDVTITAPAQICVFRNESGVARAGRPAPGAGTNFTLY